MYGRIIISCLMCTIRVINLVSLLFGTSIPTSFNILMKCFFTLVSLVFLGYLAVFISVYLFFTIPSIPTCLFIIVTYKSYSELKTRFNILLLIVGTIIVRREKILLEIECN